ISNSPYYTDVRGSLRSAENLDKWIYEFVLFVRVNLLVEAVTSFCVVEEESIGRFNRHISFRYSWMSTAKRLVLSLRGRKQSSPGPFSGGSGGGVLPCDPGGADHHHSSFCSNHELDEIAVVSTNADPLHVKYGSGSLTAANGPRLVP
ncbi:hypothetical protein L9F63_018449, partial [Diploptera punctata]